jgi:ABC-type Fe3+-hydroxamate transport system substrate-binding protein
MTVFSRRAFLAAGAGACMMSTPVTAATGDLAIIDWGLLETALALDVLPVAATELRQYREIVVEPHVPDGVIDLGLRGSPNMELLRLLKPELILISGFYEYMRSGLERIAEVISLPVYEAGKAPYALAEYSTLALGKRVGRSVEAEAYVQFVTDELDEIRNRVTPVAAHPMFVISLGDSRHFRAFGGDSMFGDVLARLGLKNAWTDETSYSAAAPIGIEALARVPEASIAVVGPLPPDVQRTLDENALWKALPAVREARVAILDPINHFGGLPSAQRFARLLAQGFER